jgi:chromosome segregation ATPase
MRRLIHRFFALKDKPMPIEYDLPLEHEEPAPADTELQVALKEAESECARVQMDLADVDETIKRLENKLVDANARHAKEIRKRAEIREQQGVYERRPEPDVMDDPTRLEVAGLARVLEATQLRRKEIAGRLDEAHYWRNRAERELAEAQHA